MPVVDYYTVYHSQTKHWVEHFNNLRGYKNLYLSAI